jgi:hypothetical protein
MLLKSDFMLSLMLAVFIAIRLCLEPTALIKRRRPIVNGIQSMVQDDQVVTLNKRRRLPPPSTNPDECTICVERMANRQLNCGHIICCCCLLDLIQSNDNPDTGNRCPFCRQTIVDARRLIVIVDESTLVPIDQCCSVEDDKVDESCTVV